MNSAGRNPSLPPGKQQLVPVGHLLPVNSLLQYSQLYWFVSSEKCTSRDAESDCVFLIWHYNNSLNFCPPHSAVNRLLIDWVCFFSSTTEWFHQLLLWLKSRCSISVVYLQYVNTIHITNYSCHTTLTFTSSWSGFVSIIWWPTLIKPNCRVTEFIGYSGALESHAGQLCDCEIKKNRLGKHTGIKMSIYVWYKQYFEWVI